MLLEKTLNISRDNNLKYVFTSLFKSILTIVFIIFIFLFMCKAIQSATTLVFIV